MPPAVIRTDSIFRSDQSTWRSSSDFTKVSNRSDVPGLIASSEAKNSSSESVTEGGVLPGCDRERESAAPRRMAFQPSNAARTSFSRIKR